MNINELNSFKLADAIKFHKELNPKLWKNDQLNPLVRKQLLIIAEDFVEELGIPDLDVVDITISGSNAAFTWTKHSDLDLHILVNMGELHQDAVYRELFRAKKTLYNSSHDITVHGVPVELYVQDSAEPVVSLGEYSILHDKWIKIPKRRPAKLDQNAAKAKFEQLKDMISLALKTKDVKRIDKALKLIKRYRQAGLDKGGEFSPENLAFKAIRTQGGINDLYTMRDRLHSKELSIEETHVGVKMKFLKPGELRGSYTPAKLKELGFKKSQNGSWFISQSKWETLRNTRQIYESDSLVEKLSREFNEYNGVDNSFDSNPYPYDSYVDRMGVRKYTFVTYNNNDEYEVRIDADTHAYGIHVSFYLKQKQQNGTMKNTIISPPGSVSGDNRKVFATIIDVVKKYVVKNKPKYIAFVANDQNKVQVYGPFVKKLNMALPDYREIDNKKGNVEWFILKRKTENMIESNSHVTRN